MRSFDSRLSNLHSFFFESRRTSVNVGDSEKLVERVLAKLSECEAKAGQQRALRMLILQVPSISQNMISKIIMENFNFLNFSFKLVKNEPNHERLSQMFKL